MRDGTTCLGDGSHTGTGGKRGGRAREKAKAEGHGSGSNANPIDCETSEAQLIGTSLFVVWREREKKTSHKDVRVGLTAEKKRKQNKREFNDATTKGLERFTHIDFDSLFFSVATGTTNQPYNTRKDNRVL